MPARFAERRKVNAKLLSCYSGAAPERGIALTDSLFAALGGAGRGHTVRGYSEPAATGVVRGLTGGTPEQRMQAEAALDANNSPWLDNPPVNRPGAAVTHLTAAQAVVDRLLGAGIVTVVLPNARGETRRIGGYTNGVPDVVRQQALAGAPAAAAEACGVIEASTIFLPDDASARAAVLRGGLRYHYATRRFVQTVVLRNVGTTPLAAPLSLVLDDLSGNATLVGATAATVSMTPTGRPYVDADLGSAGTLAPGASVNVVLQFDNPSLAGITYATRVLAGPGQR